MRADVRDKNSKTRILCSLFCALFLFSSCATVELPPPPPKYVEKEDKKIKPTANSLWAEGSSLFEDSRARRLNDLVTIKVVEVITGSGKADTNAKRTSTMDAGLDEFFGVPLDLNFKNLYGKGKTFAPRVKGSMENDFQGEGETTRESKLLGTITAKVVEVMPNGNLLLESRKDITINNEKQILVFKGMARPDDISVDNTIISDKVADAQVFYVGDGVVQDKQSQGWLVRLLDKVWPF